MIDGNQSTIWAAEDELSASIDRQRRIDEAMPDIQVKALETLRPYLIEAINGEIDYWISHAKEGGLSKQFWEWNIKSSLDVAIKDTIHDEMRSWESMENSDA